MFVFVCLPPVGNTAAYDRLVKKKPPGSLVKSSNLVSIMSQVFLVGAFQVASFFYLRSQGFYVPAGSHKNMTDLDFNSTLLGGTNPSDDAESRTWESTIIFLVSSFMYIAVAYTFSTGPPFRKPIYTNVLYSVTLVLLFAFSTFLLLSPVHALIELLDMMPLQHTPFRFRLVLSMAVGCFILSCVVEWIVMESGWLKCLYKRIDQLKKVEKSKYKVLQQEINVDDWPPVSQETIVSSTVTASPTASQAVVPTEVLVNVH
ncbi:cation-transporting ATPase [Elysia marginata]|uniref:Cation-transporting ATPase n=1 Tax=Elysia marginata TaxID=1093978 RepID=A0AAV4I8S0_9GAST|nr:cation-transporting ATPase [Elysia marginata]